MKYGTEGRITDKAKYGQHVTLTCTHHPQLTWSTKNIAPIGCRTIFFNLSRTATEPECSCPVHDLQLHDVYRTMPDVAA